MAEPGIAHLPRPLPEEVRLVKEDLQVNSFTPRELRLVKEQTGTALSKLVQDTDSDEKLVVLAWLKLRRQPEFAGVAYDELDDVRIVLDVEVSELDPTNSGTSPGSPPSAATGA